MIVFPSMLVGPAEKAGMKVPPNPQKFSHNKWPHFAVFCNIQLCRPMVDFSEHWDNAKIIAAIPNDKIKQITLMDLLALGIHYAQ